MGMIGDFAMKDAKLSPDEFLFVDAAGSNDNRLTPQAEVKFLEFIFGKPHAQFQSFYLVS